MTAIPSTFEAGPLESGHTCPACQEAISPGDRIARCPRCRHVQHEACWQRDGVCRSYECTPPPGGQPEGAGPDLVITREDAAGAQPLPSRPLAVFPAAGGMPAPSERRLSVLAVVAFVFALLGVPLFGFPALAGIGIGAVAIGTINVRKHLKGMGFAVAAVVVGLLAVVGWTLGATYWYMWRGSGGPGPMPVNPPLQERLRATDLADMRPTVRQAFQANVLVMSRSGGRSAEGSGVVLQQDGDQVFVITNRHVIDGAAGGILSGGAPHVEIAFLDGTQVPATVKWRGPAGVDAAVLTCTYASEMIKTASVRAASTLTVGERVFAVGNPFGLDWSYIEGVISAIRKQRYTSGTLRLIQIQVPLNPGNSGGGLYDEAGALIGINTMTTDKRIADEIGFAIAFADLIPLLENQVGLTLKKARPAAASAVPEDP